jgi:hypothetical protein
VKVEAMHLMVPKIISWIAWPYVALNDKGCAIPHYRTYVLQNKANEKNFARQLHHE